MDVFTTGQMFFYKEFGPLSWHKHYPARGGHNEDCQDCRVWGQGISIVVAQRPCSRHLSLFCKFSLVELKKK